MVIFPKISSDTLVPLFQPISMYYMIILPKLSSDALGVSSDLKHPTYQYDGRKSHTCHILSKGTGAKKICSHRPYGCAEGKKEANLLDFEVTRDGLDH